MDRRADDSDTAQVSALANGLRLLIGRLKRRLREQTLPGDLSWSQVSVLGQLEREGSATVTALAKFEGVRPQSMGATISGLEAAGFVTGAPHPTDGRQTIYALTETCRNWILAGRAAREDWLLNAIQTNLTAAEQQEVARAVELLKRLVDS
jgi:DNA-binding MarR family transcriptional regulator